MALAALGLENLGSLSIPKFSSQSLMSEQFRLTRRLGFTRCNKAVERTMYITQMSKKSPLAVHGNSPDANVPLAKPIDEAPTSHQNTQIMGIVALNTLSLLSSSVPLR